MARGTNPPSPPHGEAPNRCQRISTASGSRCISSPPLDRGPKPLETVRLILAPLGPEHAAALFDSLRDPAVYAFIPLEQPRSVAELEARYRRMGAGPASPEERWWNWAVAAREKQTRFFGTVEFSLNVPERRAVLGYVFGTDSWGHGFATEACRAGLAHLGECLPSVVVDAFIDTRNTRSIALIERLGFERQETLVAADYFKSSATDEHRYRRASSRTLL